MNKKILSVLLLLVIASVSAIQYSELPLTGIPKSALYYQYMPSRINTLLGLIQPSVSVETIGLTPGNNQLQLVTYGSNSPSKRVVIINRQHGPESASNFMSEGFIIEAVNDPAYMNNLLTYWVPIANPDGAINDRDTYNMNRYWNTTGIYETDTIRNKIDSLPLPDVLIDQHSLGGGELYAQIGFSSKNSLNKTLLCGLAKKYLPTYQCYTDICPATNIARGYYCQKGVKYTVIIENSMANTTYTPQVTYDLGIQEEKLIKELLQISTPPPNPFCGDLICNNAETCSSCPGDCGNCSPPPPVSTGIITGWWKLETDAKDYAGTNNGLAKNVTFKTVGGLPAASFTGKAGSLVTIPSNSNNSLDHNFTITLEVYLNSLGQSYMAQKNGDFLIQYYAGSKKFQIGAYQPGGVWNGGPLSKTSPAIGTWYRIDWSWNKATGASKIYINKMLETTSTISTKGTSTNPITVGNKATGSDRALNGAIRNFKIRNYVMTAEQIKND